MTMQAGTYAKLPDKATLQALIDEERRHNADLTSYMWHIVPIAARFGPRVYEVAARSLQASGLDVTAEQLSALAGELATPEGRARYAEQRRLHVMKHTTG